MPDDKRTFELDTQVAQVHLQPRNASASFGNPTSATRIGQAGQDELAGAKSEDHPVEYTVKRRIVLRLIDWFQQ